MVVVKLQGGLGNQLFQYAAGKSLALKHNTTVFIDLSFLNKNTKEAYTKRRFELNCFKTTHSFISEIESTKIANIYSNIVHRFLSKKISFLYKYKICNERSFEFQADFIEYPNNAILDGFWQSEKYFEAIHSEIRKDFEFKEEIINLGSEWKKIIDSGNVVSLHIRRGDYVTLETAKNFYHHCNIEYYNQAVEIVKETVSELSLFIFSDDIDWCKENLKFDLPIYFIETKNAQVDLYLMSQCQHHIIANSSFSWWGAWLGNNKNKIVIAPKKWFSDSATMNTRDLIPKSWITI